VEILSGCNYLSSGSIGLVSTSESAYIFGAFFYRQFGLIVQLPVIFYTIAAAMPQMAFTSINPSITSRYQVIGLRFERLRATHANKNIGAREKTTDTGLVPSTIKKTTNTDVPSRIRGKTIVKIT
jgi:hypothetical protein